MSSSAWEEGREHGGKGLMTVSRGLVTGSKAVEGAHQEYVHAYIRTYVYSPTWEDSIVK